MRRFVIFKDLKEIYMDLLKPLFEPFSCNAGVTVLQQDTPADYLYLVISGKVEVTYKPYDSAPITITHVEKDGLFGWSAVVGSEKYTSSAIAIEALEADALYAGYIHRQEADINALRKEEQLLLSDSIDYSAIPSLSTELQQKLARICPATLGQAARIDGMTPVGLAALLGHVKRRDARKTA